MSTNIEDLMNNDMKTLSTNIERELDNGIPGNYLDSNKLQQMQLQQMQQMQELQQMQNKLNTSDNEIKDEEEEQSSSLNIASLIKEPSIILVLYVLLSHPSFHSIIGKYIPNLASGDGGTTLVNLLTRGILLVAIITALKIFVLN